ncbi:peptidoglycan-binding protein [Scytonema sp. PCC 10023]|uniref:peptidoglycan-binding protein n=1 Tax=Scytonema sp. PCC 10023 TaxID=1680591 RepID=UPI0039C5B95E
MKISILSGLGFLNPSVNCCAIKREQRYKSLLGVEILLYCAVSGFLGFFATASLAAQPQQIAQTTSPEAINRPTLQVGSKGERVTELQAALKLLGYYTGTVDGVYNESTVLAVSRFQEAAGLKADGVVDATTWQKLFPNEPTVASSQSSPNTSRFPVPSGTSNTNKVVVPTSERSTTSTATTDTTVVTSKPEPRSTTSTTTTSIRGNNSNPESRSTTSTTTTSTTVENSKPEPKPVTRNTATSTRTENSKPEPKPVTRNTASSTRAENSKPEPKPVTRNTASRTRAENSNPEPKPVTRNRTASSQRTYTPQSTSTRSRQTSRTQQSDRPSSTTRTQQISSIQYTSEGLAILRIGARGSEVTKLQRRLQRLGFLNEGDVDGNFGAATEAAVIALQKRYGLDADGVVGGGTWEILMRRRGR